MDAALAVTPAPVAVESFAQQLRGGVIRPMDPEYDDARQVFNAAVDRRPWIIVRAADADDVARTIAYARATGRPLAVRSGGHSVAGHSTGDDVVLLDLSALRGLEIDAEARTAWAEPGVLAGDYADAAGQLGLATPHGDSASVGLGGLTLGGGVGWLVRKHGMTIDHLLAVELVTADGERITASADEHPDLFWALRGGGGNFGVATRFKYRLEPLAMVLGGMLILPPTADVIVRYAQLALEAPDELTTIAGVMHLPPMPFVPAEHHGTLGFMIAVTYAGDPEAGRAAVDPFRALAAPIGEMLAPMPYPRMLRMGGPDERGAAVMRSVLLRSIDAPTAGIMVERMREASSPMAMAQIRPLGGAMARVPNETTAYSLRDREYMVTLITPYMDPSETSRHVAWTSSFLDALRPGAAGVYSNFLDDEGEARVREAYPAGTYERLAEIKRRYDPLNVFRLNQNVSPSRAN